MSTPSGHNPGEAELLSRLQRIFDGVYVVERKLAVGGMAQLFLATDPALDRKLVIKLLPPELTSEMSIARFRREFELTAHLQHPHILPIIAAGEREGLLYYVMPYVAGESLRSRLEREGALPIADAVEILEEMADALGVAHRHGVIHRDIKPENILLQEGHAILADFGIAGALEGALGGAVNDTGQRITRTGMSVGTMGYMAPEQALGESGVDGRADIYALGVVGHEMIAGERPFTGNTMHEVMVAHLTKEPPRLDAIRPETPPAVCDAILQALRKVPEERFQTAQELRDALRYSMTSTTMMAAARTGTARAAPAAAGSGARSSGRLRTDEVLRALREAPRPVRVGVPIAALALAGVVALFAWQGSSGAAPSETVTVAVAPFTVIPPSAADSLQLWREGMVDMLARNLDNAGPLRTVSPAVVLRGWEGIADRRSAVALAQRTNARYALYGSVTESGESEVRLRAELVSAGDTVLFSGEWVGTPVELLTDSLTAALLRALDERHRLGASQRGSIGAASPLALKAFLQGEQHYRRTAWDSAYAAFARAVRADSGFAPALRRVADVLAWQRSHQDSTARAFFLLAGASNHGRGLAPRDSLLILADSLVASLLTSSRDPPYWDNVRRLFAITEEAARRYPDDPEVWHVVAEARFHHGYGSVAGVSEAETLAAFERSIRLDSLFAPAYIHAVDLGFTLRGREAGLAYARRYLALDPGGKDAAGIRVIEHVTDPRRRDEPEARTLLDTIGTDALVAGWLALRRWPDSTETAMRLLRAIEARPRTSPTFARDSMLLRSYVPLELAYRGRLHESYAALGLRPSRLVVELALLGAVPADSARLAFARWTTSAQPREWDGAQWALPWWAQQRDTAAIRVYAARARSSAAVPGVGPLAGYRLAAAEAYLALARGDSAVALERLEALADTACLECYMDRFTQARLLIARGRRADLARADILLSERLYTTLTPVEVWMAAERGPAQQRLGRAAEAAEAFRLVVAAWSRGDRELQPYVRRARAALDELGRRSGTIALSGRGGARRD